MCLFLQMMLTVGVVILMVPQQKIQQAGWLTFVVLLYLEDEMEELRWMRALSVALDESILQDMIVRALWVGLRTQNLLMVYVRRDCRSSVMALYQIHLDFILILADFA